MMPNSTLSPFQNLKAPLPVGEGLGVGAPHIDQTKNPHPTLPDREGFDSSSSEDRINAQTH